MMKVETYVLAVKNSNNGDMVLAPRGERVADMPVCFSSGYAHHLFDFSESRVCCQEGDKVFLLKGTVDISEICRENDFPDAFKALLIEEASLDGWDVIRQKLALSTQSKEYKRKVHEDLVNTHAELQISRLLIS
ncbi:MULTISPECIES: hypothetical protein [unclassified Neptuniibacter]|uniref:hypothetical protein n=1 Tax=unclassified Neptuniibacter TaxID=2630693 RepID=UPI0025E187E8|nr:MULTISPECIES: hypothetical protein [unclassified Neptuniibacter]|tara:strand:+ start:14116 stop:14517 length:402 start_codon:yes stop_codon:yes gene_type:complete